MSDRSRAGHRIPLPASGLYVLLLRVDAPLTHRVGALGECEFPAGSYAFVGSARSGLPSRVARHLSPEKPLRWHVDQLTSIAAVKRLGAVAIPTAAGLSECELNRIEEALLGGTAPIPRFPSCTVSEPVEIPVAE